MLGIYLSPLAPAAILLLSAFILSLVPHGPVQWRSQLRMQQFGAPALVGLALLSLLFVRLGSESDTDGQVGELLSGWNFSTSESVAAFAVRADTVSLVFLISSLLFLLCTTLLYSTTFRLDYYRYTWERLSGWLAIGSALCLLFVAANSITIVYATLLFDVVTALYWWGRGQNRMGVARLFLAFFTAIVLVLATLIPAESGAIGQVLLVLALLLRLGLFPLVEISAQTIWSGDEQITYYGFSLVASYYLIVRFVSEPLPLITQWLIAAMLLFVGSLAWLADRKHVASQASAGVGLSVQPGRHNKFIFIVWLVLNQSLLALVAAPLSVYSTLALIVGLLLALVGMWATPALGRPHVGEGARSWFFLPAAASTLTILGIPFFLGWAAKTAIYSNILRIDNFALVFIIVLAEALALTVIGPYWSVLWHGHETSHRSVAVGIIAMVPFLIPVLGPFILTSLGNGPATGPEMPALNVLIMMMVVLLTALGLHYYRQDLLGKLKIPFGWIGEANIIQGMLHYVILSFEQSSKMLLRIQVMFEGQHYLSWAIFAALIGAIIIVLS